MTYRAPGLRIGWLTATDPELHERVRQAKFHTTIACSTVDEFLAAQVLRRRNEILALRAKRLGRGLAELVDWAGNVHMIRVQPRAGLPHRAHHDRRQSRPR